jgi:outer membrane lipoprotein SlyB
MEISRIVRTVLMAGVLVAFAGMTSIAQAACPRCGTVTDVRTVKIKGEGSGGGAIAGGILGGVLGHQVGSGRGKDVATVAGAAGGAFVGHQTEKEMKSTTRYQVIVKLDDGTSKTFSFAAQTSYKVGDMVKIVDGKLTRQ